MIYLICFERSYKHAHHYIGSTDDLDERLKEHRHSKGARLLAVINEAGINWQLVAQFEGGRKEERKLKNRRNAAQLCPNCKAKFLEKKRIQKRLLRAKRKAERKEAAKNESHN